MPWASPARRSAAGVVLVLALAGAVPACSSGGSGGDASGGACGEVEQIVEPGGAPHVIDPEGGTWRHHPPASGAHFSGNPPEAGVHADPVPEALQVTALEFGVVVVNVGRSVGADDRAALEALAGGRDDVLVTPAATPIDEEAAVAFTGWEHRQLCREVSIDAAEAFIDDFAGQGPGEVTD